MIHLDTNFLVAMEDPTSKAAVMLRSWLEHSEDINTSALAWAEYLCGPLSESEFRAASTILPQPEPLIGEDAEVASKLFNFCGRRRGSFVDCMIAAIAIRQKAQLVTMNTQDFIPFEPFGLKLLSFTS